jgi:hypothetical protein
MKPLFPAWQAQLDMQNKYDPQRIYEPKIWSQVGGGRWRLGRCRQQRRLQSGNSGLGAALVGHCRARLLERGPRKQRRQLGSLGALQ